MIVSEDNECSREKGNENLMVTNDELKTKCEIKFEGS